jgi:hypothetical protein
MMILARALLTAVACLALATSAVGQRGVSPLRAGQRVAGALSERDQEYSDGRRFQVFQFQASEGGTYLLTVRSPEFAPYLQVARQVGPITEMVQAPIVAWNGAGAWIRFQPEMAGTYFAVVTTPPADASVLDGAGTDTVAAAEATLLGADTVALAPGIAVRSEVVQDSAVLGPDAALPASGAFELELLTLAEAAPLADRIAVGDSLRGEVRGDGPRSPIDAAPFRRYRFNGWAGQRLQFRAMADFPARLMVGRIADGTLVSVDAGGISVGAPGGEPGVDSAIVDAPRARPSHYVVSSRMTVPTDAEYVVEVSGATPLEAGNYVLSISERPAPAPPGAPVPIQIGREVEGTLVEGVGSDELGPFNDWVFTGRAGERVTITMSRLFSSLDPVVDLGTLSRGAFNVISTNDDADGFNSRLAQTLERDGEYVVRARSFQGAGTGPYILRVSASRQALQTREIAAGQDVPGTLDQTDAAHPLDGSPYEHWTYRATRKDERVVVTLSSEDFDTVLSIGTTPGGEFEEFTRNDDVPSEGGRFVSRLVAVLPEPGEYRIRVNTYGPDEGGEYVLRVDRVPSSP